MPPEPLPWDRKDFFKERKHERSEFLGPVPRWRDSSSHGSREFSRWGSGDFRRPPGHGRQGGWHVFPDEYGHGYGPSVSFSNKMLENVSSRPSVSHGDGKYSRNGRENRSFSQRGEWKGHSWATSNGSTNNGGRLQHDLNYDQRSVHDVLIYPSHSHSDYVNPRDKVKGQHDKIDEVNGLGTNQRRDREYSVSSSGWKPLKWTRSGGLSSRSSTSGHSSSTKSIDALDSNETKSETVLKNVSQNLSPSADPAEGAMSSLPCDDATARKKPRLGWGEGLAKYEKKKVEVPDGDGTAFTNINAESTRSLNSNLIEKGPGGSGFSNCTSPATPSSVICGSSPGVDEKSPGKASSDNDGFQNHYEGSSSNLEKADNFPMANLGSPLIQLLQSNDSTSVDSGSMGSTALSKLLIYKNEISKVLETTESKIDLLETELKGLRYESKGHFSFPIASSSLLVEDKYFEEHNAAANLIPPAATLSVVTSAKTNSKTITHSTSDSEIEHADVKEKDRSVVTGEKLTISGCSVEDNVVASVDNSRLTKSEGVTLEPISSDMYEYADRVDSAVNLILAANKESASKASEALMRLLPTSEHKTDIWSTNISSQNQCLMKERFAKRKQLLRFKERVITLKFKAYQSMWKESLHVPPVRKLRAKSQKKYQLGLWTNYSGYQKNRSSIRYRMPSPAGNVNPDTNAEILKHVSKQLSNPQIKQYRSTLRMPALILDQKDKIASRFISNNGLVEDPCVVEKERVMINPWTSEEKDVFLEKLECFGKDFGKIASFLDHKTTADCIEFYYKNHKSDCFERTKKLEFGKKVKSSTGNYLMTTGKKWNPETNSASLDMLGAASAMTARAHKYSSNRSSGGRTGYRTTQFDDGPSERDQSFHIFGNEREKVAADVLAGICGSLSSEVMGSCITSNFERRDGSHLDSKCKKGATTILRRHMTANVPRYVDDGIYSDESCGEMDPSYWTDGEKSLLIEAVTIYGKNFALISTHVGTKSTDQCKVFFSKAQKCLGLDLICSAKKMPANGNDCDANRGDGKAGTDIKNASPVNSQMVDDLSKSVTSMNGEESKSMNLQSTHQEVEERNPTASNAADDASCQKDGSHSALDDDCQSVNSANDKNALVHHTVLSVVLDKTAKEQDISAPVAASVGNGSDAKAKRVNVDANIDRGEKAHAANSSPALPINSHITSSSKDEQGRHHVRVHSHSFSDSERSSRNGCVKLFGQILTHSSSVPSSKSGSSENENRNELHHRFKRRLKVNSDGNLSTGKFEHNHSHSQEEDTSSRRSYRIWDGNCIRTGLPTLPDPTTLSRYPTSDRFSKWTSIRQPSCNEQKSNRGDSHISEVVNSSKEVVGGGIIVGEICNENDDDDDDGSDDTKLHCNKAEGGGGGGGS